MIQVANVMVALMKRFKRISMLEEFSRACAEPFNVSTLGKFLSRRLI
jgi:hypothetical protein